MSRITTLVVSFCVASCASIDEKKTLGGETIVTTSPGAVVHSIDIEALPGVLLTSRNNKVAIGVFQANTGEPYLQLLDSNNDGVFDLLTYYVMSAEGEMLTETHDYGMDGQPDFILNYTDNTGSVFYGDSWYEVSDLGTKQGPTVLIDGRSRALDSVLTEIGQGAY